MKIDAISSFRNVTNIKRSTTDSIKNIHFGSVDLPKKGWTTLSDSINYSSLKNVWAVPNMIMLGLLRMGDMEIYSENKKPLIAYTKQDNGNIHSLIGSGAFYPYMWVVFKNDGLKTIDKILNDENSYTVVEEHDKLVDGVKLSSNPDCSICQISPFYPFSNDNTNVCVPSRYLEIMKKHLKEENK